MVDSGSSYSIKTSQDISQNHHKDYPNSWTVTYNNWICQAACITMAEDGDKYIIGHDLFSSLGLAVVQQQKRVKLFNYIDNSICKVKQAIASQFQELVSTMDYQKHTWLNQSYIKIYSKAQTTSSVLFRLTYNLEFLLNLTDCK